MLRERMGISAGGVPCERDENEEDEQDEEDENEEEYEEEDGARG